MTLETIAEALHARQVARLVTMTACSLLNKLFFMVVLLVPFIFLAEMTFVFWTTWFRYVMLTLDVAALTVAILLEILIRRGLNSPPPWEPEYDRRYPGRGAQIAQAISEFIKEKKS